MTHTITCHKRPAAGFFRGGQPPQRHRHRAGPCVDNDTQPRVINAPLQVASVAGSRHSAIATAQGHVWTMTHTTTCHKRHAAGCFCAGQPPQRHRHRAWPCVDNDTHNHVSLTPRCRLLLWRAAATAQGHVWTMTHTTTCHKRPAAGCFCGGQPPQRHRHRAGPCVDNGAR